MKPLSFKYSSNIPILTLAAFVSIILPTTAMAQQCPTPEARLAGLFNGNNRFVTIIAHRGLWGNFNSKDNPIPENSFNAVVAAGTACMDAIELDVKMTSDKVPFIIHDYNLGRTTNIWTTKAGAQIYNPDNNIGYNPTVASVSSSQLRGVKLLATGYGTPGSPNRWVVTNEGLAPLRDMVAAWNNLQSWQISPLVFDVKTTEAVRAIDSIAATLLSRPGDRIAMKVNASLYQSRAAYRRDAPHIKGIPIFVTNNLGNIDIPRVFQDWIEDSRSAIEINVKSWDGFLQGELNTARTNRLPYGVFNAIPDYPGGGGRFYDNDGHCCYTLASKLYTYKGDKEPRDDRGNWDYINNQGFTFVTTDDSRNFRLFMAGKGKH